MASPLESAIKKTVGRAFKKIFLDATLTRTETTGGGNPWDPPSSTEVAYSCRGIHEEYAEKFRLEGLVEQGDRKVMILADSLSVEPKAGDKITIRGETFNVIDVATDPAKATWTCRARA